MPPTRACSCGPRLRKSSAIRRPWTAASKRQLCGRWEQLGAHARVAVRHAIVPLVPGVEPALAAPSLWRRHAVAKPASVHPKRFELFDAARREQVPAGAHVGTVGSTRGDCRPHVRLGVQLALHAEVTGVRARPAGHTATLRLPLRQAGKPHYQPLRPQREHSRSFVAALYALGRCQQVGRRGRTWRQPANLPPTPVFCFT